jgi:signal transduction histidine kinase
MDRASVTSGSAFTTAVRGSLLFAVVLMIVGISTFRYLRTEMLLTLQEQIAEDQILFTQIYQDKGQDGLVSAINALEQPINLNFYRAGLFDQAGNKVAGTLDLGPDFVGWARVAIKTPDGPEEGLPFYVTSGALDTYTLVVGRSLIQVERQESRMVWAFAVVGLVVTAAFLTIGTFGSLKSRTKLQSVATTLADFSRGETGLRVRVWPENDQIDQISGLINAHLDRLAMLMTTTKSAAVLIAHDLLSPLSRAFLLVDRALEMMDRKGDPRPAIEEVETELARLRSIFEAILRIARLQSPGHDITSRPVNLKTFMADMAETFAPIAEDRHQHLTLAPVQDGLVLETDEPMLAQLVANLVQNAINHCPAGKAIRIGSVRESDTIVIVVEDNGPGIPVDQRESVFQMFHQVDPSASGGGAGLGLALVKAIAERLGAGITLDDAGPGLRVAVRFPAIDADGQRRAILAQM